MKESELLEAIDNALIESVDDCRKGGTIRELCTRVLAIDLEEKVIDNLESVQDDPGKQREIAVLKNKLTHAKELYANVYSSRSKSEEEFDCKKKELTKLKKDLAKATSLLKSVEEECQLLEKAIEPMEEDQLKIDKYKALNKMFKQCTGIQWDFTAPDSVAKGYIKNKVTNNIQTFNIVPINTSTIAEKMWTLIDNTSHPDWSSFTGASNKENSKTT